MRDVVPCAFFVLFSASGWAQGAGARPVPGAELRVIRPGLAGGESLATPDVLYLCVDETEEGQDLNADGDLADRVLHRVALPEGTPTNLGLDAALLRRREGELLFTVSEQAQRRRDLNGDGDRNDFVWHVLHEASGTIENVRRVGFLEGDRELAALLVDEQQQGADLDGDGRLAGRVLHAWPAGGTPTSLRLRVDSVEDVHVLSGARLAFVLSEAFSGDRNGDGDALDRVLHVYHAASHVLENRSLALSAASRSFLATPTTLGFLVNEAQQGGLDLNGDGDALDDVVHLLGADGSVRNLALAAARQCSLDCSPFFELEEEWVVVSVGEAAQGAGDLDGDGATTGIVPFALRLDGTQRRAVGARGASPAMEFGAFWAGPEALFYHRFEARDHADWNADGDQDDLVLFVRPFDADAAWNTGLAIGAEPFYESRAPEAAAGWLATLVSERAQGLQDRNGDGDTEDLVLAVVDLRTRAVRNTRLASRNGALSGTFAEPLCVLDGERLLLRCVEEAQGRDLNADGDRGDDVVLVHELASGRTVNSGIAAAYWPPRVQRAGASILVAESPGRDLNGDGDFLDRLIEVLRVRFPRP